VKFLHPHAILAFFEVIADFNRYIFLNDQGESDIWGKSLSISGGDTLNQVSYMKPEILRDIGEDFPPLSR
jgi:hypothetical protein